VDAIEHNVHAEHADEAIAEITSSAILGPFWRRDAPLLPNGSSIIKKDVGGDTAIVYGTVLSSSGKPIEGAEVDVWHTAPNGLYEQQDPDQPEYNLRGRFLTDKEGKYSFHCLRPTSYPIPYDGAAGKLLQLMDRHPYRPAHIHLIVKADGHRQLTTQIFDRRDKYVNDDSVFAVKDELVVDFVPRKQQSNHPNGHPNGHANATPNAMYELEYDITLKEKANKS
jgi:catechol 1,2-dioxygenase